MLRQQAPFFDRTTSVMNKFLSMVLFLYLTSATVFAGGQTSDAAVGGGIGGAIGAAIGAEIDGRNGAIIGSGVGAAIGAAVATQYEKTPARLYSNTHTGVPSSYSVGIGHPKSYHCPPGQAKKDRC